MLDKKRFEEIKDKVGVWSISDANYAIVDELITAYEQAQTELAEAEKRDMWGYKAELDKSLFKVTELRKQFEASQKRVALAYAEIDIKIERNNKQYRTIADLRKQLATSQAEVERLETDVAELEDAVRKNAKPTGLLI